MTGNICQLSTIRGWEGSLSVLLQDSVNRGASLGFVPPMSLAQSQDYWQSVEEELTQEARLLLVALDRGEVFGAVQLALCQKPNGGHRAEVEKLMVHPRVRCQGIGRALMSELEAAAQIHRRSLLVLDTRAGDVAARLYQSLGYKEAGQIPRFALSADGGLDATVLFYKCLIG
ncbi:GNAT family N-acetyltransferase [Marinobacter hydrocarbonoclasticus]|nr:GNAT family N-acetyltransferase [Marinobacter nauticus]